MTQTANCQPLSPVLAGGKTLIEPPELTSIRRHNLTVALLALMMFLVPALGVPGFELLQDTLKSMLVSFFALTASLVFFWPQRESKGDMQFHSLLCFPLVLMAYALGSMAWSHTYLGGVEAIRWFVFSLILFLGMNTLTLARVTHLAWGIHLGAVVASIWAALQFWFDFSFFSQGPSPASTFFNRNLFAEFLVCTFPFAVFLMSRVRSKAMVSLIVISLGLNVVALMMTGARAALTGLWLLVLLLPAIIGLYRKQFAASHLRAGHAVALVALLIATIGGLGSINTTNRQQISEHGRTDAIDRAFKRTLTMTQAKEYSEGSFSIRARMWMATVKMIQANPVAGVGAGAWEVYLPLHQEQGSQRETDVYAHNDILQLLAEYGLVGWLCLLSLLSYLLWAAYRTWSDQTQEGLREAPLRALTLASLLALLLVSNAGFPWRIATTGALFAVSLSILAASDMRIRAGQPYGWRLLPWRARYSNAALGVTVVCLALALYISQQAAACETKFVRAYTMARTITLSDRPYDPRWETKKTEIRQLMREGIAINPHYRRLIPQVADELASWGDSENAAWIWDSMLRSRPYIVVIAVNISRAYLEAGNASQARLYFDRAAKLQPTAPAVRELQAMFLIQSGQYPQAAQIVRDLLQANEHEDTVIRLTYLLGAATRDWQLTIQALSLRIQSAPINVANDWVNLGNVYNKADVNDEAQALASYRAALNAAPAYLQGGVWARIPPIYQERLRIASRP